jgi:eukaryotic-like serine/threonine-protein kinase
MKAERWQQVERLYHSTLEKADGERAAFLAEACAGDDELRREVESLLAYEEQAANFIESPALDVAAQVMAREQVAALQAGKTLSHYKIISPLGAGGMGEVYRALDTRLGREVAIKLLPDVFSTDKHRLRRFEQEARAAGKLNHPNIAHIYEIGESDGTTFIAMEYVEGTTLREQIHREQAELRKLLRYLQHVAEGLAKAHAAGIVHRDLKPDNVIIAREGYAKILDFGLAKLTEQTKPPGVEAEATTALIPQLLSTPGIVIGTVGYMSPEQAEGKAIDHRSDIFSFGCLLYEAATGQRAFESGSTIDTLHKIVHTPVPLVKDVNPAAPADLTRIVRRCLAKDPDERYQSIREAAIELRELRRELEAAKELDTTVPPGSVSSTTSRETAGGTTASGSEVSTAAASRVEYIITGIKQHKLAAFIILAILVLGGVGLAAYLHSRNTEVPIDSIAVLPFVNQSRDQDTEYLSDGLTESIINNLTQLSSLRVSPRSTVFQYKGKDTDPLKIGHDLGVRAVVTGRLLQRGDSLIVSAELLDVRDNKQVWGDQYNRKLADALAVQQQISREISERLRTKLSGEEQRQLTKRDTSNPDAYAFYLKGRYYWNKRTPDNLRKSIEQFQLATDKDPNYALAYVGLADSYTLLEFYAGTPASETLPKAKAFAERALQLDNSLAEAHTSLAIAYDGLWQWDQAEEEFKRALELNPNYPTAHHWHGILLLDTGRSDEALTEAKRAQQLDPLSLAINQNVSQTYLARGDVDSAIVEARKVIELDPRYPRGHMYLGFSYVKQGNYEEGIAELQKAADLPERDRSVPAALGYGYAVSGRRAEALAMIKDLEARYERHEALGVDLASIYAGLGDKDQAFAWLEKDFQARSGFLPRVRWYVPYESLRSDPRFADLLRRIGLKP